MASGVNLGALRTTLNESDTTSAFVVSATSTIATLDAPLVSGRKASRPSLADRVSNFRFLTDPLGNLSTRTYDQVSRLLTQTDPRGKTTTFAYDALNRLTNLADLRGGATRFTYDGNGNLLTVTDALNHAITYTYDSMDRLATRTDPLGRAESFSYDGNGNLVSTTDRKSQTTAFTHDALNRRVTSTFADSTTSSYLYDAAGRLAQADDTADSHRPITLSYDTLDRLVAETTALGTVSYEYDVLGRRIQMQVNDLSPVSYTYDAASRLRSITQAPLNPADIQYDALGRRITLTLPNGVSTEYQYDAASRLTALIYQNAVGIMGDLTYTYDATGNRTGVGGSFARTLVPDPVASATYDAANQQLTFGDKSMTYDANGNLTSLTDPAGATIFTWDARNRLTALDGPGVTAAFAYDALGRRAGKQINGSMTQFEYDGVDIAQQVDATGTTTYLRSLNIDEAVGFTNRDGTYYSTHDPLGSTVAVTGPTGTSLAQYTYDPFGTTSSTNSAFSNPFQYTSREHDLPGLYYYRVRYYSPVLHRFASEDPIGMWDGENLYLYVGGNPVSRIDPFGLDWEYAQSTGRLTHVDNQTGTRLLVGTGYAGYGPGLNNPAMQDVTSQGPIPQGIYTIGPQQLNITAPPERTRLPASMRRAPRPGTNTLGRSGFLIHGGNFALMNSSRGCIVLPLNIRNQIGNSGDTTLRVVP